MVFLRVNIIRHTALDRILEGRRYSSLPNLISVCMVLGLPIFLFINGTGDTVEGRTK